MVYCIADNIWSPLGTTTAENYQAVKAGRSALCRYEHHWGLPEAFTASLFSEEQTKAMAIDGLTRFESLAVRSAAAAIAQSAVDVTARNVVFILSTTKANIELLADGVNVGPAAASQHIARYLGFTTPPVAVCNACISGVAAIVLALRLLEAGRYDYAVVCGADVQNAFTVSGFQSLKAVAEDECRPFDMERLGLNLGEAAATLVLSRECHDGWAVEAGVVRNDGFHISSPSKDGEGARQALAALNVHKEQAFINAHGTATMFNDQMESVAIERAGLQHIPVNAYKGYFGHTLGAAGVLETVLSMAAADDHTILGTRGFEERGVSGKIRLSAEHAVTDKQSFVKMISGFGGANGALLVKKVKETDGTGGHSQMAVNCQTRHHVLLTPSALTLDGKPVDVTPSGRGLLTDLYKQYVDDYPKYYKMDGLSRLGFVASELLLKAEGDHAEEPRADRAVILFNHSSSIAADRKYQESIADSGNFFPSPSVFVYTLPNIVTGEIAIRHQYRGETSFYILPERDDLLMEDIVKASFADSTTKSILTGWLDYVDEDHFEAELIVSEII